MRHLCVGFLLLCSVANAETTATVPAAKPVSMALEPVAMGPQSAAWEGPQFVRADKAGNVYFFQATEFIVHPLTKSGELGEPVRLEKTAASSSLVQGAALSPNGDQWLVYADVGVRLFVDGKEKPLPAFSWRPWSVGFQRGDPVVAVLPVILGEIPPEKTQSAVPWLLSYDGNRWLSSVEHRGLSINALLADQRDQNDFVAQYAVFLAGDTEGKLWLGRQYAYSLQRLSPTGRPLLEITVDGGKVTQNTAAPVNAEAEELAAKAGAKRKTTVRYHRFSARPVIRDLAVGRDHRLYILANSTSGGDLVLDRYDPARVVLERLPLKTNVQGRATLAAGKDGLYLAAWNGNQGRWKLTWESLDSAAWQEVPGAEIRSGAASE